MPYIKQEDRNALDNLKRSPQNAGELNYVIHLVLSNYEQDNGVSYQTYNDMIGALEAAKMELYRRKVAVYEDKKVEENGDILFYCPETLRAQNEQDKKEIGATHAVFMQTRKGYGGGIVFSGTRKECVAYCEKQEYPAEFCDPTHGEYGNEDERLEIVTL